MARASVFIYITIALLVLLLISQSPKKPANHRHRRLKLRSNFTFTPPLHHSHHNPIAFDPLVADIERRREDRKWEKEHLDRAHSEVAHDSAPAAESQPEWEDFMDAEDYLNDEERFNVTNRLVLLFPKVDVDPADGFVSEDELTHWNLKQAQREVLHRTQRDMDLHDKNRDGFVSFQEYQPPSWVQNAGIIIILNMCLLSIHLLLWYTWKLTFPHLSRMFSRLSSTHLDFWLVLHEPDNNSFGYDMGWWKEEHFNASDADGDGLLNLTEFNEWVLLVSSFFYIFYPSRYLSFILMLFFFIIF